MRRRFSCQSLPLVAATLCLALAAASCGGGGSKTSFPPPTPTPAGVAVTISPTGVTLVTQQAQAFTATVTGSTNIAVNWQVNQIAGGNSTVGTITPAGVYSAPASVPSPAMVTVTAVSQADSTKSANATVTITDNISVTVSPTSATLAPNAMQQFTAVVTGTIPNNNTSVNWSVNGTPGGNSTVGTVSATGLYTAPSIAPSPATVTVTATSQADNTKSGNATVTIEIDNKLPQNTPIKLGTTGGNSTNSSQTANKIFCCSGTLGSLVSRGGTQFILSNNHVLDKSDQGMVGQPISQPGLAEANCDANAVKTVAILTQAAPLKNAPNNVDAAIAQVNTGDVDPTGSILDLAGIGQAAPPSATLADPLTVMKNNETVAKSGSASGLTCSTINSVMTNVSVDYSTSCQGGTKFTVLFNNQVDITGGTFSTSGDSGSLIVTGDKAQPVALLFAGAANDTVANPIADVLNALQDSNTHEVPAIVGRADHTVACPAATQSQIGFGSATRAQFRAQARVLTDSEIQRASIVKSAHAAELMHDPAIIGLDVSASEDDPREAAIVIYTKAPQAPIPHLVDGVRTRVVYTADEVAQSSQAGTVTVPRMTREELLHGVAVKAQHVDELMSNPAIIGVGVGASHDNPSEPAVVVFIEQDKQASVPAEIDGVRTRIQFTDRFRAFGWGKSAQRSCSRQLETSQFRALKAPGPPK